MREGITLTLQNRTTLGKKVKRLRREGIVPVHLYGTGIEPRPLQCESRELVRALTRAGGNTPVSITIEGEAEEHLAFAREIQWNPVKGDIFHVDFLRAEATQRVSAEVPVVLAGTSPGARGLAGTVVQQLYSVTMEALPLDMPQNVTVDLSLLTQPDGVIRAGDISIPAEATLITSPEAVVARVEALRVEEVAEAAPADEPLPDADGGPQGT